MDGVEAYWFKLADHAFESRYDDPETACFCKKKQCMKKGLGNITPCYWSKYFLEYFVRNRWEMK